MRTTAILLYLTALTSWPNLATAQGVGFITGYVKTAGTQVPVAGANVRIVATDAVARTNVEGYFVLRNVPPGRHTLVVQALGYQPTMNHRTDVTAATLTTVDFEVRPISFQLDPIEVRGDALSEGSATDAVSVIRGTELPPEGDIVLSLSGRVPGLSINFPAGGVRSPARTDAVTVTGRNNRPMMWVLDGVSYEGAISFYVDAGSVDCMEIRQGTAAAAEYARAGQRANEYGGVILIWTKLGTRRRFGACN